MLCRGKHVFTGFAIINAPKHTHYLTLLLVKIFMKFRTSERSVIFALHMFKKQAIQIYCNAFHQLILDLFACFANVVCAPQSCLMTSNL